MILNLNANIENVEEYEGKNGYGCNVTVSQLINKKRELLTFTIKDKSMARVFENSLQEQLDLEVDLMYNAKFGLRIADVRIKENI